MEFLATSILQIGRNLISVNSEILSFRVASDFLKSYVTTLLWVEGFGILVLSVIHAGI